MELNTREEYIKDPRIPCKYGVKCYQKNSIHLSKYKHPPRKALSKGDDSEQPFKKDKSDDDVKRNYDVCNITENTNNEDEIEQPTKKQKTHDNIEQLASTSKNGCYQLNNPTNHDDHNTEKDHLNINEIISVQTYVPANINKEEFIKRKFLVEMPPDFYSFWDFCKNLKESNPLMALNDIGLALVGPFDVLAGKFNNMPEKSIEEYVLHWRYYYDPPEFQTVIKRNDNSGYHLGYFRDFPDQMPVFLAYNFAKTDGTFTIVGDNLFAAVSSFLDFLKKNGNPFMKANVIRYSNLIQNEANKLKLSLSTTTSKITSRNKKILTRTFNKLGLVVPYNRSTQLGYRPLTISNKELQTLLNKLEHCTSAEKDNLMIQLQEVLTNTNIAIDECDFGTGLELGLGILCYGVQSLNSVAARFLTTCYRLLNRETFAIIAESHMKRRRKDYNLSVL